MRQPHVKFIISFLFLVVFLVPRVTSLHAFEHVSEGDDALSCELCDITSHTQQFQLYLGEVSNEYELAVDIPSPYIVNSFYDSPIETIVSPTSVYNKPPPIS